MKPEDLPDITPDLSTEDDAAIRDLLATLGGADEQMPAAVSARLDAAIAEQARERGGSTPARNVRRLATAWVGAAAVVVLGVTGIGVALDRNSSGDDAKTTQFSVDDSAGVAESAPSPEPAPSDSSDTAAQKVAPDALSDTAIPVIRPGHVAEDAAALVSEEAPTRTNARVAPSAPADGCVATREPRPGVQVFAVTWQGEPAVLMVTDGPPREATVWSCDDEELASAELPD